MKKIEIWTDGSCVNGKGGWAAVLTVKTTEGVKEKEISGTAENTTNNQMELRACIEALKSLKEQCKVTIHTDSEYVRKGITEWMKKWIKNGWKTAAKKPVLNKELWHELDEIEACHEVEWKWVRGHNGDPMNERADILSALQSGAKR